jgi:hypothetical protein
MAKPKTQAITQNMHKATTTPDRLWLGVVICARWYSRSVMGRLHQEACQLCIDDALTSKNEVISRVCLSLPL